MKRTGKAALLSVKGHVDEHVVSSFTFFKSLLANNWWRIRTFDVELQSGLGTLHGLSSLWERAEHLESFHFVNVSLGKLYIQDLNHVAPTLFADDAPRLRHFHCNVSFHLLAPWMTQLRSLSIPSHFRVPQILDALAQLPLLESLKIDWMKHEESDPPTSPPRIQLPYLKNLKAYGKLENTLAILRSVFPPPGCALSLTASAFSDSSIADLVEILEKFWKSYLASTEVTKLSVYFDHQSYQMTTIPREPPAFSVSLTFRPSIPPSDHPLFLGTLSSARLMRLKELHLCQDRSDDIDPLDPTLVSFISSQQFVESLVTSNSSLAALLKIASIHPIPFPRLQSFKMWRDDFQQPKYEVSQTLIDFLSSRRAANLPISVVDLTEFSSIEVEALGVLNGMEGLKILLKKLYYSKVSEYLCGHGLVDEESK